MRPVEITAIINPPVYMKTVALIFRLSCWDTMKVTLTKTPKRGEQTGPEGCLSVPGKTGMVTRAEYVKAKALDIDMNPIEVEGEGLLARAICHELDHLDGHLYTELVEGKLMTNEEFMEYLNANAKEGDSE